MVEWSTVVVDSALWTVKAFVITLVVSVAVIAALVRFTRWGRQWWRIAASYFDPRAGTAGLGLAALVLFLTVFAVRMNVLFSYWYNDFYTAIQNLDEPAFWRFMRIFALLATVHVLRALVVYLVGQTLDINWRTHLNERLVDRWLDSGAYYRERFVDDPVDNPDQRIQVDITDFVTTTRVLSMGAVNAVLSIVSFTGILWDLSGPMTLFGVEIPRLMVFLVFIYVLVTTAVAFWIGRPLIRLNFLNEKLGATYRYALVRVREYGESIAFYRGEPVERGGLLAGNEIGSVEREVAAVLAIGYQGLRNGGRRAGAQQAQAEVPVHHVGEIRVQQAIAVQGIVAPDQARHATRHRVTAERALDHGLRVWRRHATHDTVVAVDVNASRVGPRAA